MHYVSSPTHFRLFLAICRLILCLICISSNIKKKKTYQGLETWDVLNPPPPALRHVALSDGCNMGVVMVWVCGWPPSSMSRPIISVNIFYERNKKKKNKKKCTWARDASHLEPLFPPLPSPYCSPSLLLVYVDAGFVGEPLWYYCYRAVVLSVKIGIVNKIIKKKRRLT